MATDKIEPHTEELPCEERRGRGRPQARCDEETRAIIIEAALRELAAGYAATSMEGVARGAGVSTKTLYRLIPNKAALFEAMITDRIDRFAAAVQLRACEGRDIESALRDALLVCGELILAPDVIPLQRTILAESDKFPDVAETFYRKAITRTQATLASWLQVQHKRGLVTIEDAEAAAGMLLGMLIFAPLRAAMYAQVSPPNRAELEQRAAACARLFLQGCGKRE